MSKSEWNVDDIPDLTGKIIVVTGGNSGLGFESVKAFTAKGARVVMACRSVIKGEEAAKQIAEINPSADIEVMALDLMDLSSIERFAWSFKQKYPRLNVLLNNAGIMTTPYQLTRDGFEGQMGTNHLGHFALTGLLMEVIGQTPQSRVVTVSSMAHRQGNMDFDNLLFEKGKDYTPMKAYARSKLANLLFTFELQRWFDAHGVESLALAAHPGISQTNLFRHIENKGFFKLLRVLLKRIVQEPSMGALPQIRAATDPEAEGGVFFGPDGFRGMKGHPVVVKASAAAQNVETAKRLWAVSEKLTGVVYREQGAGNRQ